MNFYEILKTKKLGRGSPDYWTQLFAEHVGGKGEWKIAELTGTLPMTFRSNGTALINYRIYGTADGAGVETENLFNFEKAKPNTGITWATGVEIQANGRHLSDYIPVEAAEYTTSLKVIFAFYNEQKNYVGSYNGSTFVTDGQVLPLSKVPVPYTGYIRCLVYGTIDILENCMFTKGSLPETYIPYGFKIPLELTSGTESKDTDIYIGDSKLGADEYVDYESGKIYKAKRIHEDTVTIDGIVWDILDYDHDEVYKADGTRAKHTVTIQTHDCINRLQYSAKQAAFAFPDGLAAGTYHFTVGAHPLVSGDVGKVLTFTLANAIPSGGQLVFNGSQNQTLVGTTILAFASATDTTVAETVTMTEGSDGADLGTILRSKTATINSIDRALRGSDNWIESAMRQYLNSDKAAGSVWTPQSVFDRPPTWAATTAGFINGKSPSFISHIGTAKKTTGLNTISDGGKTAIHDEKVFLLSRNEAFTGYEYAGGEDTPYAYYKNYSDNQRASSGADKNRIKYREGAAQYWWIRSPSGGDACGVRLIGTSGAIDGNGAFNANNVAPACCIVLDDMDEWVKQTFYTEVDADLPVIETFKGENTLDSTETLGKVTIKGQIKPQS